MRIRRADAADAEAIARIIMPVIRAGESYAFDRDMREADALVLWLDPAKETFVAEDDERVLGTYFIKPNQNGGGSHVANCGYATAGDATGRGVARAMCAHSIEHARERGYRAIQFNFVISTNTRAVALWQAMGFDTVGVLPGAFQHPAHGFVDALVMYRAL